MKHAKGQGCRLENDQGWIGILLPGEEMKSYLSKLKGIKTPAASFCKEVPCFAYERIEQLLLLGPGASVTDAVFPFYHSSKCCSKCCCF